MGIAAVNKSIEVRPTSLGGTVCTLAKSSNIAYYIFVTLQIALDLYFATITTIMMIRSLYRLVTQQIRTNVSRSALNLMTRSRRVTPKEVESFHVESREHNQLLLLCAKLLLLNVKCCVTSFVLWALWIASTPAALFLDVFANLVCMWLSFKFSSKWFNRLGCNVFIKCLFPVFKAAALSGDPQAMCCVSCCGYEGVVAEQVPSRSPGNSPVSQDTSTTFDGFALAAATAAPETTESPSPDQKEEPQKESHCLACCCTDQASMLFLLSRREWDMYKDEMK